MNRDLLALDVADLLAHPGRQREEQFVAFLDDLVVVGSRVRPGEALHVELHLQSLNEGLVVRGSTTVSWVGECRRCLGTIEASLVVPILEVFEDEPTEGETQPLHGSHIFVEPVLREAVLLDLPLAPVCRVDCHGLCPSCGIDRNQGECGCSEEHQDPRWVALDELRFD